MLSFNSCGSNPNFLGVAGLPFLGAGEPPMTGRGVQSGQNSGPAAQPWGQLLVLALGFWAGTAGFTSVNLVLTSVKRLFLSNSYSISVFGLGFATGESTPGGNGRSGALRLTIATLHESRHWHNWLPHPARCPAGDYAVGVGQILIFAFRFDTC